MLRLILAAVFSVALLGGADCPKKDEKKDVKKEKDEGGSKM